jgi:hypothetical protein
MNINLPNALASAGETYLMTGNPAMAVGMGALGAFAPGSAGNLAGNFGNGALSVLDAQNENFQVMMYGEQIRHQEQMQLQSEAFDEMMDEKSEQMREVNTLRDVQMAQRKADNGITKKFIESITE